jgi:hypothetical protein
MKKDATDGCAVLFETPDIARVESMPADSSTEIISHRFTIVPSITIQQYTHVLSIQAEKCWLDQKCYLTEKFSKALFSVTKG